MSGAGRRVKRRGVRERERWKRGRRATYLAEELFSPRAGGGEDHSLSPQLGEDRDVQGKRSARRRFHGRTCGLRTVLVSRIVIVRGRLQRSLRSLCIGH